MAWRGGLVAVAARVRDDATFRGTSSRRISAFRCVEALSRHRRDSFPGTMDVGGFFFDSEPIPGETLSVSRSTGETPAMSPESGCRRSDAARVRQSTRRRCNRGPGRLEPPRGPRVARQRPWRRPVSVVAVRSVRTTSRGSERSTSTPSPRRVRRRATP